AELAERDIGGRRLRIVVGQRHWYRADGVDAAAIFRSKAHRERKIHLAFVDPGDLLAADRRLHHRVDVADREAVASRLGAVDLDDEIGLAQQVEAARIGDAG